MAVFDKRARLRVVHRPARSAGWMGDLTDWGVRRWTPLVAVGAAAGVAASVFDLGRWMEESPYAAPLLVLFLLVLLPLAYLNGREQVRLNLLNPDHALVIPFQWRGRVRRDPGARAQFLHELSHLSHGDAGRRRLFGNMTMLGRGITVFQVFMLIAPLQDVRLAPVLFAAGFCGYRGLGLTKEELRTVQELRADAESCDIAEAVRHQESLLSGLQAKQPTRCQATRLDALRSGWAETGTGRTAAAVLLAGGGLSTALGMALALSTGWLPAQPL